MNNPQRPGLLRRLAGGTWHAINFSRRLVLNLIFLLVLVWLFAVLMAPRASLDERTALVIAPQGELVEQFTVDPTSRAAGRLLGQATEQVQLRDLLRAIEHAREDERIERIVLRTDGMYGIGFAAMHELADALGEFRAAGKQVVAYANGMEQRQYYIAAHADEVYLHPGGTVLIEGLARYRPYYREALEDKLGIDVHLFRVGEYKSAAEPYIRDSASEEDRAANLFWMNDIWQRMLAGIAGARGLDASDLEARINRLPDEVEAAGGDLGQMALRQNLVDGLMTADELRALLTERGVADEENNTFRQVSLDDYLEFVDRDAPRLGRQSKVAVVVAQGAIMGGDQPPGAVGGESTSRLIRQAREDDSVKALVLRVDSPGGGVFPSEQIRREVELTRAAGKPVVVSMANVAASGGYWISMDANEIIADPSTITGSIGIFGLWLSAPDTLEKVGVRVDGVGTTRFAGAFDPSRSLDPEVGRTIQSIIDHGYRDFIAKVAQAREKTPAAVDKVARGRVWSGAQAHEYGLVDRLGGLRDAIAHAAGLADIADEFALVYIERPSSLFERFLTSLAGGARAQSLAQWVGLGAVFTGAQAETMARDLAWLRAQQGEPLRAVAHCFCEY